MNRHLRAAMLGALMGAVSLQLAACGGGGSSGGGSTPTPTPVVPASPTLTALTRQPPANVFLALLLTDGSVLVQAEPGGPSTPGAGSFYKLTPDASGSYLNGTWTRAASPPAGYAPYASGEAVLADGRVLFVGGEYNQDNYAIPFAPSGLTNMSAVYDPVADAWTMIAPPPGLAYIGDVASAVLPDGRFVFGDKLGKTLWSLDPGTLTWSRAASSGKGDAFAEEGFTLLPNGSVLVVDMANTPQSEHYVIATGTWVQDGPTPVSLTSPTDYPAGIAYGPAPIQTVGGVTYGPGPAGVYQPPGEIGPAILRPDGTVFATGSAATGAGHTAIYTPGATAGDPGAWKAGPDFAGGDNAGDSNAALLPNGNVLVASSIGALYEFDGARLTRTRAGPIGGASGAPTFLLPLPSGEVLVLTPGQTTRASLYASPGSPQPAWAPTIVSAPAAVTRGQTYALSGRQLNGLSQAAAYGDEFNAPTNYPLVRLTFSATGHVVYARTHGHTSMGVATGSLLVTTSFDVPATAETGAASLAVIANGIASAPVAVTVN